MNFTIAAGTLCNWQLAEPLLRHINSVESFSVMELTSKAAIQHLADSLTTSQHAAVICYAPLEWALEQAAVTNMEPSQALALWKLNATQLVTLCKQQRDNVLLFNLAEVLAAPQLFKTLIAQRWPSLVVDQTLIPASTHTAPTINRLLSHHFLVEQPQLTALAQQLTALATPLVSSSPPAIRDNELDSLVNDFQAAKLAQQQLVEKKAKFKQENSLLLEQLHQVQEKLEVKLVESIQYEKQITELNKEQVIAKQSAKTNSELKQENALLLEQLFIVQEELEQYFLGRKTSVQAPTELLALSAAGSNSDTSATNQLTPTKSSFIKRKFSKRAEKKRLQKKAAELASSSLFDSDWYLAEYADVATDKKFNQNPALHYLQFGGFEGRNPSPNFDSQAYLDANPDVASGGFNPLYHYLRFGETEQRPLY